MLSSLRANKKNQPFILALLGLLAFGLVGFASGGVTGGQINSIGKVGDEPIPVNTYAQSLRGTVQNIARQIGRELTPQEVAASGIQSTALQNVISAAALSNEASRIALSAGNDNVANEVVSLPAFTGIDGKFDDEAYKYTLERSGLSVKEYEDQTRKSLARGLIEAAVARGVGTPEIQASSLIAFVREQRSIEWVSIDASSLDIRAANPTDAQLEAHYSDNPAPYTAPLTRQITYTHLAPEMLADNIEVPEGILEAAYQEQTSRFNRPARRAVDRISFPDIDAAKAAKEQLDANVFTFDSLATERGLTIGDIDLGEVEQGQLTTDVDAALFGTKQLGIVGPIETDLGPALFRVNASMDAQTTTFEEAKEELLAEFVGEESRLLIVDMVEDINDLLAQGLTLEEIATETDMVIGNIGMHAQTEEGIAAYDAFRQAALSVEKRDLPELLDLSDGGIFAIRLDDIIEPTLRPLADVKDQVAADWALSVDQAALETMANDLASKLEAGQSFADLGLTAKLEENFTRDAFIDGLPRAMIDNIFTAETGKTNQISADGQVVLSRLSSVTAYDTSTEDGTALMAQVRRELGNQVTGDLLVLFANALEQRDGVNLNQTAINQINTQILGGTGN
jgi:peptidyl-prolyl cis-trans isomerase D